MAKLWVKPEPFILGILPVAPNPKLAPRFLKRILPYIISKKESDIPKLSYVVWRHIACNKLQIPEDITWLYFTLFHSLRRGRHRTTLQWDNLYAQRTTLQGRDYLKNLTSVNAMKFVILLYLQQFNRISIRTAVPSTDEVRIRTSRVKLESRCNARSARILDEKKQMSFVVRKLRDIVDILADESQDSGIISLQVIEALGFLVEGTLQGQNQVLSLCEISLTPYWSSKLGYVSSKRIFNANTFLKWISDHLVPYPYGPNALSSLNGHISPSDGTNIFPLALLNGQEFQTISHVMKRTVAENSDNFKGTSFRIQRCRKSHIYLLFPLRSVVITKCRDTTVVLGPTEASVLIYMCKGVRVIGICRQLLISESSECSVHVLTPSRPLILGDQNRETIFGPYNTTYPRIEDHMEEVGIGVRLNQWDNPLEICGDGHISEDSHRSWQLLPPQDFFNFNIPFDFGGPVKKIPVRIPEYQAALRVKKDRVRNWHATLQMKKMTLVQKDQLKHLVQTRFHAWLKMTGFQSELDQLAAFERAKSHCEQT